MKGNKKERDISVELLRIVAAIIVIGTHIKFTDFVNANGDIDKSKVMLDSFLVRALQFFLWYWDFSILEIQALKNLLEGQYFQL